MSEVSLQFAALTLPFFWLDPNNTIIKVPASATLYYIDDNNSFALPVWEVDTSFHLLRVIRHVHPISKLVHTTFIPCRKLEAPPTQMLPWLLRWTRSSDHLIQFIAIHASHLICYLCVAFSHWLGCDPYNSLNTHHEMLLWSAICHCVSPPLCCCQDHFSMLDCSSTCLFLFLVQERNSTEIYRL